MYGLYLTKGGGYIYRTCHKEGSEQERKKSKEKHMIPFTKSSFHFQRKEKDHIISGGPPSMPTLPVSSITART